MTDAASPNFASIMTAERTRIGKERDALTARKTEIDTQIAALDRELEAISAYDSVKNGRSSATSSSGGSRRTGQRQAVLDAVKNAGGAITAAKVLATMNATSDADKTSVRNALSALKKAGTIKLNNGAYTA